MGENTDALFGRIGVPANELVTPEDYAERQKWWASPAGQAELQYRKENPELGPPTLAQHEYAERVKYWNSPEGQVEIARIQAESEENPTAEDLARPQYDDAVIKVIKNEDYN